MANIKIKNEGVRAVAIPYHGGTETIGVGEEKSVEVRKGFLTDEMKAHLELKGVIFGGNRKAKTEAPADPPPPTDPTPPTEPDADKDKS